MDGELTELERGQRRPAVGTRERPARRARHVPAGAGELEQDLRSDERAVDGQDDTELGWCGAQSSGEPDDRSAHLASVVQQRERQLEAVGRLADREPVAARRAERPPAALRERLALVACERLRRAEAGRGAADEQDARQAVTRHGSL